MNGKKTVFYETKLQRYLYEDDNNAFNKGFELIHAYLRSAGSVVVLEAGKVMCGSYDSEAEKTELISSVFDKGFVKVTKKDGIHVFRLPISKAFFIAYTKEGLDGSRLLDMFDLLLVKHMLLFSTSAMDTWKGRNALLDTLAENNDKSVVFLAYGGMKAHFELLKNIKKYFGLLDVYVEENRYIAFILDADIDTAYQEMLDFEEDIDATWEKAAICQTSLDAVDIMYLCEKEMRENDKERSICVIRDNTKIKASTYADTTRYFLAGEVKGL